MSEMNFFIICKDILQQRAIFKNRYYCTYEVDAQVRAQMSEMISVTSEFHISWNSVMIASPQTIMLDPRYSRSYHYIISFYHITSCMSRYVWVFLHKSEFHTWWNFLMDMTIMNNLRQASGIIGISIYYRSLSISDTLPSACLPFKTISTPNRWQKNPCLENSEMFKLCLDSRLGRQQPRHLLDELVQPAEDNGLLGEEDERVSKEGFPHTRLSHALTWLLSDQIPGLALCHHLRDQPIYYRPLFSAIKSPFQFLLRCGFYRHPDPGAKAKVG